MLSVWTSYEAWVSRRAQRPTSVLVLWWTKSRCECVEFVLNPVAPPNFLVFAWCLAAAMAWPQSFRAKQMQFMGCFIWCLAKRKNDWTAQKAPMKSWKHMWKPEPQLHWSAAGFVSGPSCLASKVIFGYYFAAHIKLINLCFVQAVQEMASWFCAHSMSCVLTSWKTFAKLCHPSATSQSWSRAQLNTTFQLRG